MAKVIAYVDKTTGEKESVDSLLRRFKKQVIKEEILLDLKKHEYYRSKSLKRKEKAIAALKRSKKKSR